MAVSRKVSKQLDEGASPHELVLLVFIGAVVVYLARELFTGSALGVAVVPVAVIVAIAAVLYAYARHIRVHRAHVRSAIATEIRSALPVAAGDLRLTVRWVGMSARKILIDLPQDCPVDDPVWRSDLVASVSARLAMPLAADWVMPGVDSGRRPPLLLRGHATVALRPLRRGARTR